MTTIKLQKSRNAPYVWINQKLPPIAERAMTNAMSYKMTPYSGEPYTVNFFKSSTNGDHFFPIGLIDIAENILQMLGYQTEYMPGPRPAKTIELTWHGPKLWPHQQKAVKAAISEFAKGRGVILHIPTRGGKTTAALQMVKDLGVSTLVVVHTEELMRQWKDEIKRQLGVEPGCIKESTRDIKPITLAMVQTLERAMKRGEKFHFDFLICDEIHHFKARTFWYVAMRINAWYRCGLSATPRSETGDDMKFIGAMGKIVKPVSVDELIERGILVKPKFEFIPCECNAGYTAWEKAYKKGIVKNEDRNRLIEAIAKENLAKGKQVYIHVIRIDHGKILEKRIDGAVFISGKDTSEHRAKVLDDFKKKRIQCVISTLLGEGVDIPSMDVLINAASGKSWTTYVQRLGRVLTASDGKTEATIVDFLDYGNRWLRDHSQRRMEIVKEMFGDNTSVSLA